MKNIEIRISIKSNLKNFLQTMTHNQSDFETRIPIQFNWKLKPECQSDFERRILIQLNPV